MTTREIITHYAICIIAGIIVGGYVAQQNPLLGAGLGFATFLAVSFLLVQESEYRRRP